MKIRNIYIAIILYLVFSIPLVYQNLHIIHHRHTLDQPVRYPVNSIYQHQVNECLICDFKFTSFNNDTLYTLTEDINYIVTILPEVPEKDHLFFSGEHSLLRAPPVLSVNFI